MRVPDVSVRGYRRLTASIVVLLGLIIVSGAAVRLTNSGLGCTDWPNCNAESFISVDDHHEAIEQLNRLLSGVIGVPIVLALVAAYRRRPRRHDLISLTWVLFALFLGQAVLGGITVLLDLAWVSVMGHFLLAIVLVGLALTLHQRGREPDGPAHDVVPSSSRVAVRVVYALTVWVLTAGTLVTAAGPHGGDIDAERLDWPIADVARLHGVSVVVLIAATLVMISVLRRDRAPRRVMATAEALIGAMCIQALIGYVQYFNEIPALLVGFHVAGAVLVFSAVHQLHLELRRREPTAGDASEQSEVAQPATV